MFLETSKSSLKKFNFENLNNLLPPENLIFFFESDEEKNQKMMDFKSSVKYVVDGYMQVHKKQHESVIDYITKMRRIRDRIDDFENARSKFEKSKKKVADFHIISEKSMKAQQKLAIHQTAYEDLRRDVEEEVQKAMNERVIYFSVLCQELVDAQQKMFQDLYAFTAELREPPFKLSDNYSHITSTVDEIPKKNPPIEKKELPLYQMKQFN